MPFYGNPDYMETRVKHKKSSLPKTLVEEIIYEYRVNNRPISEIKDWLKHKDSDWIEKDLGLGFSALINIEAVIQESDDSVIIFDSTNDVFYINKKTLKIYDLEEYPVY